MKKLKPLYEINENEPFYCGTIFRKYNVGVNTDSDFFDYMLVHLSWEKDMIVVNVTENSIKRGYGYSGVIPVNSSDGTFSINKKGLKHTFGENLEDWFLVET